LVADHFKWGRKAMARVTPFHNIQRFYTDTLPVAQIEWLQTQGVVTKLCP